MEGKRFSGSLVEVFYEVPLSHLTPFEPYVVQNGVIGTYEQQLVDLTVGGLGLDLAGRREEGYLQLTMVGHSGARVQYRWSAISEGEYNALLVSFKAHVKVRLKILALKQIEEFLPGDSDRGQVQFKVAAVKQEVDFLVSAWEDVEVSKNRCQVLKERIMPFYPLPEIHFSLPDAAKSTLAESIGEVEDAWMQAQRVKLPELPISLSWRLIQQEVDGNLQASRRALQALQDEVRKQGPVMKHIQQRYRGLVGRGIEPLRQACGL
jgi:hypothetical protein